MVANLGKQEARRVKSTLQAALLAGLLGSGLQHAAAANVYGPQLEGFAYPYPLKHLSFTSQGKNLQMGYLDVPAQKPESTAGTVVLLHGKNFCCLLYTSPSPRD